MAKTNLTMQANINATVREVDFVSRFQRNWESLREILGVSRPIRKAPGTKLAAYNATVTLQNGAVGEGEEIPYSLATVQPVAFQDIVLKKYAKAVSIEAVNKYGARLAVEKTDEAFLNELQGEVLTSAYAFLQTGTLTASATTFQAGVAEAIGQVRNKWKAMHKDITRVVVFVNTLDAYKYLGVANLALNNAFGIDYVESFMGARLILTSDIPQGKIIATPMENMILYYVDPSDGDFQELGLFYRTVGETRLIGFHVNGNYNTAVGETFALMGMVLMAEYLDGIAVITVGEEPTPTESITLDKDTLVLEVNATGTLAATTIPAGATVTWTSSDETVATVANGVVTGVANGEATITATNGSATDTCAVTVGTGA